MSLEITTGKFTEQNISVVLPNSAVLNLRESPRANNYSSRLIFLSGTWAPWHGFDRLERLAALHPQFIFDIYGDVGEHKFKETNVKYCGELECGGIELIAETYLAGIGPLALDRKGMVEACPLKVRDYLRVGLPVIASYTDTAFSEEWAKFFYKIQDSDYVDGSSLARFLEGARVLNIKEEQLRSIDERFTEAARCHWLSANS